MGGSNSGSILSLYFGYEGFASPSSTGSHALRRFAPDEHPARRADRLHGSREVDSRQIAGPTHRVVVYLHAPFQTLIERCLQQERMGNATYRPLLHQTETANLRYQARKLLYSEHAQLIVDVAEKSPQEIAGTILEHMHAVSCTLQQ
jgi:hypothetical protein